MMMAPSSSSNSNSASAGRALGEPASLTNSNNCKEVIDLTSASFRSPETSTSNAGTATASAASKITIIHNPYSKPKKPPPPPPPSTSSSSSSTTEFVGGAEQARRNARRKTATRIARPGEAEQLRNQVLLSRLISPMDRFFACLLRNSAQEFLASASNDYKAQQLWETTCRRVALTVPSAPLPATFASMEPHYHARAALVLEEARFSIANSLQTYTQVRNKTPGTMSPIACVAAQMVQPPYHFYKLDFQADRPLTRDQQYNIRPGGLFLLQQRHGGGGSSSNNNNRTIQESVLGVVVSNNRNQLETKHSFTLFVYELYKLPAAVAKTVWTLTPLCTLVSESRCFCAMMQPARVLFQTSLLLGNSSSKTLKNATPTHIRFTDKEEKEEMKEEKDNKTLVGAATTTTTTATAAAAADNSETAWEQYKNNHVNPVLPLPQHPSKKQPKQQQQSLQDCFARPLSDSLSLQQQQQQLFRLPFLNPTQQTAATTFLQSPPGTITLIQGPPGTGKTTLLSSIICQYILKQLQDSQASLNHQKVSQTNNNSNNNNKNAAPRCRLMVCAPTNKAISVLATRFLQLIQNNSHSNVYINAIMVGDSEKLLGEERSKNATNRSFSSSSSSAAANNNNSNSNIDTNALSSIFLFTWMQNMEAEYRKIRNYFMPGSGKQQFSSLQSLLETTKHMERRLRTCLPTLPKELFQLLTRITQVIQSIVSKKESSSALGSGSGIGGGDVVILLERLLKELKEMPQEVVARQLLANAQVIFCTLSSAGGLVFKNTLPVDDLIVDEAAAASEPELCIPFHLRPNRLLAVGDPLQLPATVLSRKAEKLGLAKSLHERLMFECNHEHVMLDVQYRMHPEISSFPSMRFYESKIANGPNVTTPSYSSGSKLLDRRPYTFLHVAGLDEQGLGGSYRNPVEARVVLELLTQLASLSNDNPNWFSANHVRVITFYQAQVQLLKRTLMERPWGRNIVVATVDSSQGTEADIVIVSFVRGRRDNEKVDAAAATITSRQTAGFLTDDRRMNVALTRARHQLICVGNARTVGTVEGTLQMLTQNAQSRQILQSFPSAQPSNSHHQQLDLFYGRNEQSTAKKMRYDF